MKTTMRTANLLVSFIVISFSVMPQAYAVEPLVAVLTDNPPKIDGRGNDPSWELAKEVATHDLVAGIDIHIKAVTTDKRIFLLVKFPDTDESRSHKSWVWDKARQIYRVGYDIEDTVVFKWNMENGPVDLSIYGDNQYRADIWFWKACRTDPAGHADDKMHLLSFSKVEDSTKLTNKSGRTIYLHRLEDSGKCAYLSELPVGYSKEKLPRFTYNTPDGSRSDIKAKGVWEKGIWTIEFSRLLETGNRDDVQFNKPGKYQFGVSRYEIAGRDENPKLSQPLYGKGDISENLILIIPNLSSGD